MGDGGLKPFFKETETWKLTLKRGTNKFLKKFIENSSTMIGIFKNSLLNIDYETNKFTHFMEK